ncbi:MAG: ATP-binding protein [Thermotogaceae bacterium]|nr:ATP-binding protein [Thermotogaceae bacterium]
MRFWDREKEVKDLKAHIESEPNSILFVYGPKSSGKSTLLSKVVEELPKKDFVYYWYDLREKVIVNYKNVLEIFFKEKGWLKEFIAAVMPKINLGVFEMEPQNLEKVLSGKLDAFEEMRKELEKVKSKGQTPVIVFDELQRLKDVYINGERKVVDALFNFFVRLTKVLHLSHVIVMTSDTFFIEEVYTSSSLKNTSIFYLADYFDDETARKILIEEGLSEDDADYIVNMAGGMPWVMVEVLSNGDPREKITALYKQSKSRLKTLMMTADDTKKISEILRKILQGNYTLCKEDYMLVKKLVENEILFYDPINDVVKFQTKLDERAAKELLIDIDS